MLAKETAFGYQYEFVSPPGIDVGHSNQLRGMAGSNNDDQADYFWTVGHPGSRISIMRGKYN